MLLSWLSKTLATLLVAVLTSAMFTMVLNQTVLNSKYLQGHLKSTDSYNRLSVALSDQITKTADNPEAPVDPVQVEKLKTIITPTLLETKINGSLDQLESYYRGNGKVPTLDLTDVVAQAEAAGIPIPEGSGVREPITFGSSEQALNVSKSFDQARTGAVICSVVIAVALLFVSWRRGKWGTLPSVVIVAGVLLGIGALVFLAVSSMAGHAQAANNNGLELVGRDLVASITGDLARRIGAYAVAFVGVGIVTRILVARLSRPVPQAPVSPVPPMTKAGLKRAVKA